MFKVFKQEALVTIKVGNTSFDFQGMWRSHENEPKHHMLIDALNKNTPRVTDYPLLTDCLNEGRKVKVKVVNSAGTVLSEEESAKITSLRLRKLTQGLTFVFERIPA